MIVQEDDGSRGSDIRPDVDIDNVIADETVAPQGERRERRGDSLWRVLNERQINMIAFSGTIGNGLFLGSGRSIARAGPGGAVMSIVIMGSVISSVISCVGEMTALMPVNAPMMEFPRRFLDRGVGFAVGWVYWFAYAVLAADQLVAVSNTLKFRYDDSRTFLSWPTGEAVDTAIWVSVFLILVIIVNLFPVRFFGELEYVFGSIKLAFICLLIVLMLILDNMKPGPHAYYDEAPGTKYWNEPYSFFRPVYQVRDEHANLEREIEGPVGTLVGVWTTFINTLFSFVGMDIVVATAAESRTLADAEAMKMAARKISIRILTIYSLAVLTASFLVPYDHPFINGQGQSLGSHSVFLIAAVEAGFPVLAHFFNGMFVFSAFTCAINSLYIASRVLHTLALRGQTGPEFITRRLRACRSGVPTRAVFATGLVMMVGYLGRTGSPRARLDELANNCTVSCLIVYGTICATYLSFFQTLEDAQLYGNTSEAQAASYDRNHPRYPYKSHGQWLKAAWGLFACIVLILFNGIVAFIETPFNVRKFISAYITVPVYIALIIGYKFRRHGFRFSQWGPERSCDLSGAVQVSSAKRRGRLELPDEGFSKQNWLTFVHWLWVWIK
ncbi:amino acid permease domain-containing protein [Sarocladium implicatum]|nr:amino acid permease domain-containing protein [Sarocladium implicatum]